MVSRKRQKSITARLVALAGAAAAPCTAFAQSESFFVDDDEQRQILNAIETTQAAEGPYSLELLDPLKTLGVLYQEGGDHRLAIAALERAQQVVRANYGLRSLEQAPLIQQRIFNEEAIGDTAAVWELEQDLQTLARQHPEDLRTVPILREIGDRRMSLLGRFLGGEYPEEIYLGCYYGRTTYRLDSMSSCNAGSRGVVIGSLLSEAWNNYAQAIDVLLRNEMYSSEELQELEMQIIRTAYHYGGYGAGRGSLRRLIEYRVLAQASIEEQIEAVVRYADWDLLFLDSRGIPLRLYESAYGELQTYGVDSAVIDRLFSPEVPVMLPTFLPNPLVPKKPDEAHGYIDVAFEITRFGRGRNVRVIEATPNATERDKHALTRLISRNRFRPQVVDGAFPREVPVVVRYYLDD